LEQLTSMLETTQTMANMKLPDFLNCLECLQLSKIPNQTKQLMVKAIHSGYHRLTQTREATDRVR